VSVGFNEARSQLGSAGLCLSNRISIPASALVRASLVSIKSLAYACINHSHAMEHYTQSATRPYVSQPTPVASQTRLDVTLPEQQLPSIRDVSIDLSSEVVLLFLTKASGHTTTTLKFD